MSTRVDFDVLVRDRASNALNKIGGAFRKVAKDGEESGRKTGVGFSSSFKKWMSTGALKELRNSGKFGGQVFGSGLLGALKTPVLGPLLVTALVTTFTAVMPAVGAVAAGGLITGLGAGLAGLGLVFAAKSEEVKKVWSDTMTDLGRDMELLSRPFERTLINIAGIFRRTVDAFNPHLAKAFGKMAGPIEAFVDEAGTALEQLIPAIDPITDAFNQVLEVMGPALHNAIGDVSDSLVDLAESVERNPTAIADLVEGIGSLVTGALDLITTLNDANAEFETLTGGVSLVEVAIGALKAPIDLLAVSFGGLETVLAAANAVMHDGGIKAGSLAAANQQVAAAAKQTGMAAQHAAPPMKTLAERTAEAKQKAAEAKQKFEELITSMFRLQNLALGLSGAQINLADAIDNATTSIKDNGRNLDLNSEKGRANRTALNNVASAANQQTEAMLRSGKGSASAAVAAEGSRRKFVTLATQMGLSKRQAEALARQLIAIPNVTRTAKLEANKRDLDAKLRAAREALKDPNLTKARRAQLQANIAQLLAAKRRAQAAIDALRGKTVTIRSRFITERIVRDQSRGSGGHAPGEPRAFGGPVRRGMPYIVGDGGRPELFVPDSNGTIVPEVPRHAGGAAFGSAPAPAPLVIDARSSRGLDRMFATWLVNLVRTDPATARQLKVLLG